MNLEYLEGPDLECTGHKGGHEWRLISETLRDSPDPLYYRRWYCVYCRLVEAWTSE